VATHLIQRGLEPLQRLGRPGRVLRDAQALELARLTWRVHWALGNGYGTFTDAYNQAYLTVPHTFHTGWAREAHNAGLASFVELGVFGGALVLYAWLCQFRLLRSEVGEELQQAKTAALSMGAGAGLIATGGILSALMLVHGLHRSTRLPLWGCYGLVGGLLGAMGTGLLAAGRYEASRVELAPPPQTLAALREDLEWLKDQTDPNPT